MQYHQYQALAPAPPQLASYPGVTNGVTGVPSAPGGVLPQQSLTGSFHEATPSVPVKDSTGVQNVQNRFYEATPSVPVREETTQVARDCHHDHHPYIRHCHHDHHPYFAAGRTEYFAGTLKEKRSFEQKITEKGKTLGNLVSSGT